MTQKIYRPEKKIRATFEKLTRLNRRLSTVSQLKGQSYRWVFKLSQQEKDLYWVEKKYKSQPKEPQEGPDFEYFLDNSFYPEPQTLPSFLNIKSLQSHLGDLKAQTEGLAYIYYYPKGPAQEVAIHLNRPQQTDKAWTLYLNPASKNLELIKGLKDLNPKGGTQ